MKVCVLGANAFSGQDFVDLLLDDPSYEVIGVSRSPERSSLFLKYKTRADLSRYRYRQLDANRDMPAILGLLDAERPEAIVNFAAQSEVAPSWEHPEQWYETNCVALAKLVNHLRKQDYLRRYLHVSTNEVYGTCAGTVKEDAPLNPSTPYAASKAAADVLLETYRRQFGFPLLTVRSTNVYGARQQLFKIIPRSVIFAKLGKKIELHGGGVAVKSYIHIRDISMGEKAILESGRLGEIYHLSPDAGVEVREVVRMICDRLGRSFEEAVTIVGERPGQDKAYVIDSNKARTELGWRPVVTLERGLGEVVDWVNTYWDEIQKQPLAYEHKA
ncbi:MAG: dTDP-glucose 4,6-dehydratase [Candidatus Peregrinibacteria bacterium Gr01-1014_25]|nr:MAG: dTDP-glucose 4,6-dehydratase [Candidatus Peregrinibacteria bacterium Gr01-1014_25]